MSEEFVGTADVGERIENNLGNDSSKFSGSSGDTVRGRTVTSWEDLTGYDEGGGVGTEVLEEVGQAVEEDKGLASSPGFKKFTIPETHADEKDGEYDEAHKLDRLSSPTVDKDEGDPVSRDETSDGQDHVANADVPQVGIDFERSSEFTTRRSETNGGQYGGTIKSKAVEGDLRRMSEWFT